MKGKQRYAIFLRRDVTLKYELQCSGHRPVCNRCTNRGLNCEYSIRELRTTTRPITIRKDLTEIPAPQPAKYSGVGRSAHWQNHRVSTRAGGALRSPSSSYGTNPPPYTPRRGLTHDDKVRWLPSQQSQALSVQDGGSHIATKNGLPAPMRVRHRSAGATVSNPSCWPACSMSYQLPPLQPIPVIRVHEEHPTYTRNGIASMPMPVSGSLHPPFGLEMPRRVNINYIYMSPPLTPLFSAPSDPLLPSFYHDFGHEASPCGTRRSLSQGPHRPCFLDDTTSHFTSAHTVDTSDDYWLPVCSNIIPPPPPPMRHASYLYPEYTSEDLSSSPVMFPGDKLCSPVSALSSSNHSGASSPIELVCPAPIIPIGIGNYNHDEDENFGSLGVPHEEPVYVAPIPDFGDCFDYSLTL